LRAAGEWLRAAGSATPSLDAQALLVSLTSASRATVLAYPERSLTMEQAAAYADLVARRAAGAPVAYLIGQREFMGLTFQTDTRALIPRPETELLVEAALAEIRAWLADTARPAPVVADIGTGSGAIAIALATLEPRLTRVYATDISGEALALARENAVALGAAPRIEFLEGDLLNPLPEPVDIIVANLPYIAPEDADVAPSVRYYEPHLALYSPEGGLEHIRRLLAQAPLALRLNHSSALFLEFGYNQRAAVERLARQAFPSATLRPISDYAGWDRAIAVVIK
jgi:release factor glutamine methyltransferase